MPARRVHAPDELAAAVASARSWRGVLRALGRSDSSAGTYRAIRRQVESLGIDCSHFTGQRTWSDSGLRAAVAASTNWSAVLTHLGLSESSGNLAAARGAAVRLGLNTAHLTMTQLLERSDDFDRKPRTDLLRVAAPNLAAGWFQLRGYDVLWPHEGCRYDLLVEEDGAFIRVQVKTTTSRTNGALTARLVSNRQDRRSAYDIDEVDRFFVIDMALDAYLIPYAVVAGRKTICLEKYVGFRVAQRGQWLTACASPEP